MLQDVCTSDARRNGVGARCNPCETVDKKDACNIKIHAEMKQPMHLHHHMQLQLKLPVKQPYASIWRWARPQFPFCHLPDNIVCDFSCVFAKNDWIFLISGLCIFGIKMHKMALKYFEIIVATKNYGHPVIHHLCLLFFSGNYFFQKIAMLFCAFAPQRYTNKKSEEFNHF